jgi:hypothetical protein
MRKHGTTPHRETVEYLSAARRFIRRAGERCAEADEVELRELLALQNTLDEAVQTAVNGLRAQGHSWQYIATATGTSRQAVQQRWDRRAKSVDPELA